MDQLVEELTDLRRIMISRRSASLLLLSLLSLPGFSVAGWSDRAGDHPRRDSATAATRTGTPVSSVRDSSWFAALEPNRSGLQYGYGSAEELIDALLRGTAELDTTTLADLAVSATEWKEILYPEMGLHFAGARDRRPEIRDMIGELHFGSSLKGLRRLLRDYGGIRMQRRAWSATGDTLHFPSYTIYERPDLLVSGPDGPMKVTFLGSLVEKDGVWKLLSYQDADRTGAPPSPGR